MNTTNAAVLQVKALGQIFSLMARFKSGEGLLFVLDIKEVLPPAQSFADLKGTDQQLLKDKFVVDKDLQGQLDKDFVPPPAQQANGWTDTLKALFHYVHFKEVALYWDKKQGKTLFYLEVYIELKEALASKDGGFALEYISLDIILSSGDDEITEEDKNRKQKITEIKNEILGEGKQQEKFRRVNDQIKAKADAIERALHHFNDSKQKIEQAVQRFTQKDSRSDQALARITKGKDAVEKVYTNLRQQQKLKEESLKHQQTILDIITKTQEKEQQIKDLKKEEEGSAKWKEIMDILEE